MSPIAEFIVKVLIQRYECDNEMLMNVYDFCYSKGFSSKYAKYELEQISVDRDVILLGMPVEADELAKLYGNVCKNDKYQAMLRSVYRAVRSIVDFDEIGNVIYSEKMKCLVPENPK